MVGRDVEDESKVGEWESERVCNYNQHQRWLLGTLLGHSSRLFMGAACSSKCSRGGLENMQVGEFVIGVAIIIIGKGDLLPGSFCLSRSASDGESPKGAEE